MYNRYIPQPDGTFRRNSMQDIVPRPEKPTPEPPPPSVPHPEPTPSCSGCIHRPQPRRPVPRREPGRRENGTVSSFLKQLLPRDFDVEDLLVVLLLLLMAGDCQDNQNTALLTLVLYLFL